MANKQRRTRWLICLGASPWELMKVFRPDGKTKVEKLDTLAV